MKRDKFIPFPDCSCDCAIVKILGCGECESVCPSKFNLNTGKTIVPPIEE